MNKASIDHEEGFSRFVTKTRRVRIKSLLSSPKGRKKLIGTLAHFSDFDRQYVVPIAASSQNVETICELLRKKGAPPECYVFSENPELDRRVLALPNAIGAVIGFGYGTFISCVPGRLAYYESEVSGRRVILERIPGAQKAPG